MKNKTDYWMIGLLVLIVVLLLLIKFPIQIEITKIDCPEVICKEVICKTTVEIINKTTVEYNSDWTIGWADEPFIISGDINLTS